MERRVKCRIDSEIYVTMSDGQIVPHCLLLLIGFNGTAQLYDFLQKDLVLVLLLHQLQRSFVSNIQRFLKIYAQSKIFSLQIESLIFAQLNLLPPTFLDLHEFHLIQLNSVLNLGLLFLSQFLKDLYLFRIKLDHLELAILVEAIDLFLELLVLPLHLLLFVRQKSDLSLVFTDQLVDVAEEGRSVLKDKTSCTATLSLPLQTLPQLFQLLLQHLHPLRARQQCMAPVLLPTLHLQSLIQYSIVCFGRDGRERVIGDVVLDVGVGEKDAVCGLFAGQHFLLLMLIIAPKGELVFQGLAILPEEGHITTDAPSSEGQLLNALLRQLVQTTQFPVLLTVLLERTNQNLHLTLNIALTPPQTRQEHALTPTCFIHRFIFLLSQKQNDRTGSKREGRGRQWVGGGCMFFG